MNTRLFGSMGAGIVAVGLMVAGFLYWNRGAHVELKGGILKVRTQAMEENSAVVVIDFRFVNPSNRLFVVRKVEVFLEDAKGQEVTSQTVSEVDARRLFKYYPLLGQKYNDSLVLRDKIGSGQSMDRMVVALFTLPEAQLQKRRRLRIAIEDVDGNVSEVVGGAS